METCPKNTTNLTGAYKKACNQCVHVDRSALDFRLGVGRSTLQGLVTAINCAIQCISVS